MQCLKPADYAYYWFSSMWVIAVPYSVTNLLTMLVYGSLECEWLLCLVVFQACWQCLSLALQRVSVFYTMQYFKPTNYACPWLSSMWVAAVPFPILNPLIMPVLDTLGCEWLHYSVSTLLTMTVLNFLDSEWPLPYSALSLLTMLIVGSSVCEWLLCLAVF